MKTKINQMVIFRKSRGCHLKIILHSYLLSCQVLSYHIPFLVSSIEDFKDHIPRETDMKVAMNVYELSSAAGLPCEIDPALVVALSSQKSGDTR